MLMLDEPSMGLSFPAAGGEIFDIIPDIHKAGMTICWWSRIARYGPFRSRPRLCPWRQATWSWMAPVAELLTNGASPVLIWAAETAAG